LKQNVDEKLEQSEESSAKKSLSQNLTSSYYDNLNAINLSVSGTSPKSNLNVLDNFLLYDNLASKVNVNNDLVIESYDNIDNNRSSSINSLNQLDTLNKNIIDQLCYVTDYSTITTTTTTTTTTTATTNNVNDDQDLGNIAANLKKEVLHAQRQAEKLDKLDDMTITKVVQMNIPSKLPVAGDNDDENDVAHLDESWQTLIREVKDLSNLDNKSKNIKMK
jgi:hypothetical protein